MHVNKSPANVFFIQKQINILVGGVKLISNNFVRARPSKFEHYLNRAKTAAERSTCLRRKIGAIIIKNDTEISSGYVGSPRNTENCIDRRECIRIELGIPSGQRYELCRSVHAEQNAIVNAARSGISILDGELYISSEKINLGYSQNRNTSVKIYGPCLICKKLIINSGISKVHMREEGIGVNSFDINELKKLLYEEENDIKENYLLDLKRL
jgi:dCMP deaminase